MTFRKFEWIPTLFLIGSLAMFITLGSWQMERLVWKERVIAESNAAKTAPALATLPEDLSGLTYRRVLLTGTFLHDKTIHLIGRQQGMDVGYYIVTPFSLEDDGRIILVNRGFSPLSKESKPQGITTVEGLLRPAREKRYFAPENMPNKNIWSYEDMDKIAENVGSKPLPLVVEALGKHESGVYPIPNDGTFIFRNDHLGYALTWYGLAMVSVVMYIAYYRKKKDN
jgi:surfeit locus 1 family protein